MLKPVLSTLAMVVFGSMVLVPAYACSTDSDCTGCNRCSSNANTGKKECVPKDAKLCGNNIKSKDKHLIFQGSEGRNPRLDREFNRGWK